MNITAITATQNINASTAVVNTNGIQSGQVTHHQDQLATGPVLVSFKTKNTKKIIVVMPTPFELLFILLSFSNT